MTCVVIGVGNPYRRDDAVGIEVARRLRAVASVTASASAVATVLEHDGEPAGLLHAWAEAEVAYLVDAVCGDSPGRVHRFEISPDNHVETVATVGTGATEVLPSPARDSSHALGLADAVALGRTLGRLPRRLVLLGIEGVDFGVGEGLSDEVDRAATVVATELADELIQQQKAGYAPRATP